MLESEALILLSLQRERKGEDGNEEIKEARAEIGGKEEKKKKEKEGTWKGNEGKRSGIHFGLSLYIPRGRYFWKDLIVKYDKKTK